MDWILLSYCLIDYPLKKTNWPADLEKVVKNDEVYEELLLSKRLRQSKGVLSIL